MTTYKNPEQAADDFLDMLDEAAKNVAEEWFQLSYAASDGADPKRVDRERVYCYELYHQFRMLNESRASTDPGESRYVLSGEIDKGGLNVIERRYKPDFLWHVPGTQRNSVAMEVKATIDHRELCKDIRTLSDFLNRRGPGYACGVMLIFGRTSAKDLRERALKAADQVQEVDPPIWPVTDTVRRRIHLLLHTAPGNGLCKLGTLKRRESER